MVDVVAQLVGCTPLAVQGQEIVLLGTPSGSVLHAAVTLLHLPC